MEIRGEGKTSQNITKTSLITFRDEKKRPPLRPNSDVVKSYSRRIFKFIYKCHILRQNVMSLNIQNKPCGN